MKKAAVLWTGGKDSVLAMVEARTKFSVAAQVTFVPDPPRPFLAHPLELMRAQADSLKIEHRAVTVLDPLAASYEEAIDQLAAEGFEVLVTGDMARVDGHDNWIVERSRGVIEVERPLWGRARSAALRDLLENGIEAVCTLNRIADFKTPLAGQTLDSALVAELLERHGKGGFDACGENGEYHTGVLYAPGFETRLQLRGSRLEQREEFCHLAFDEVESEVIPPK